MGKGVIPHNREGKALIELKISNVCLDQTESAAEGASDLPAGQCEHRTRGIQGYDLKASPGQGHGDPSGAGPHVQQWAAGATRQAQEQHEVLFLWSELKLVERRQRSVGVFRQRFSCTSHSFDTFDTS